MPLRLGTDPLHAGAKHQSLHHFVANASRPDSAVLARVRDGVVTRLRVKECGYWIVEDTGFLKRRKHSVGVARKYCGQLGK